MFKLYHPLYGEATTMCENFVGARGVRYIGASWGRYRTYANLPASEVTLVRVARDEALAVAS